MRQFCWCSLFLVAAFSLSVLTGCHHDRAVFGGSCASGKCGNGGCAGGNCPLPNTAQPTISKADSQYYPIPDDSTPSRPLLGTGIRSAPRSAPSYQGSGSR